MTTLTATTYTIGQTISGTFSKLPFTGTVVGFSGVCLKVQVENPVRNLPVCIDLISKLPNILTLDPGAINVTIEQAPAPAAPAITYRLPYDRETRDHNCLVTIGDDPEQSIGYAPTFHEAEIKCQKYIADLLASDLLQSATALDGVCACGATFNEYGRCEACAEFPFSIPAPLGECRICGAAAWTNTTDGLLCPDHAGVLIEYTAAQTDPDDTPTDDHNLVTPDPAECPDVRAPQPVEDLPTLLTEPDDDEPADEEDDDWPDGIDEVLAPSWPTRARLKLLFIGERQSVRAAEIGATWENGRMAAKQLHDALRALHINPTEQRYLNLWTTPGVGPTDEPVSVAALAEIMRAARDGYTIIGMGRLVSRVLADHGITHLLIVHPAARGAIRKKERYAAHLAGVLNC